LGEQARNSEEQTENKHVFHHQTFNIVSGLCF
jgi:hypothetical protein